jgi:hypothetical protein
VFGAWVIAKEGRKVRGILYAGSVRPFYFDRYDSFAQFDDEVNLGAVLGAEMVESPFVSVLKAFPNLDPDPLFEVTPGVRADDVPIRK